MGPCRPTPCWAGGSEDGRRAAPSRCDSRQPECGLLAWKPRWAGRPFPGIRAGVWFPGQRAQRLTRVLPPACSWVLTALWCKLGGCWYHLRASAHPTPPPPARGLWSHLGLIWWGASPTWGRWGRLGAAPTRPLLVPRPACACPGGGHRAATARRRLVPPEPRRELPCAPLRGCGAGRGTGGACLLSGPRAGSTLLTRVAELLGGGLPVSRAAPGR